MTVKKLSRLLALSLLLLASPAHAGDTVTYFVPDQTGSPVAAMDAQGNVLWREAHGPWGERLLRDARNTATPSYTGKPEDRDTGLVYMGARWYDPAAGRFTGIDPVGFGADNVQTFNRYAYANNAAYVYVDPDGRVATHIGLAGAAVFLTRELGGEVFTATTGIPAPFSLSQLGRSISKRSLGDNDAYRTYKLFAEKADFSTARNAGVVYSGEGNRVAAESFARQNGKVTLEMTPAGKLLDQQHLFSEASRLSVGQALDVWATASHRFAEGLSGTVVGFVRGARPGSIFSTVESKVIEGSAKVTNFITGGY